MRTVEEELKGLTQVYGPELMLQACKKILEQSGTNPEIKVNGGDLLAVGEAFKESAAVLQAAMGLARDAATAKKPVPVIPDKYRVLFPEQLLETSDDLLIASNDIMEQIDGTYERRGEVLARLKVLETEIQLKEAEAFMVAGDGQAVVDGKVIKLNNAEMRDAYRRQYSAELRRERATLEAELAKLEEEARKYREDRRAVELSAECQQKKAALQTALLNFLARA